MILRQLIKDVKQKMLLLISLMTLISPKLTQKLSVNLPSHSVPSNRKTKLDGKEILFLFLYCLLEPGQHAKSETSTKPLFIMETHKIGLYIASAR